MADGIKLDYSDITEGGSLVSGTYEVVIKKAEEGTNPNGKSRINFDMIIRRDVNQKFAGAHIFDAFWPSKADGKYNKNMLMQTAQAAGLENGKQYADFGDFLADFSNKPMKVQVSVGAREYEGKTYDDIRIRRRSNTDYPKVDLIMNGLTQDLFGPGQEVDISEDDLPF